MADIFRVETSESLQATNGTPKRRIVCSGCQKKKCKVSFFPFYLSMVFNHVYSANTLEPVDHLLARAVKRVERLVM